MFISYIFIPITPLWVRLKFGRAMSNPTWSNLKDFMMGMDTNIVVMNIPLFSLSKSSSSWNPILSQIIWEVTRSQTFWQFVGIFTYYHVFFKDVISPVDMKWRTFLTLFEKVDEILETVYQFLFKIVSHFVLCFFAFSNWINLKFMILIHHSGNINITTGFFFKTQGLNIFIFFV